jgi:hypothetical protein
MCLLPLELLTTICTPTPQLPPAHPPHSQVAGSVGRELSERWGCDLGALEPRQQHLLLDYGLRSTLRGGGSGGGSMSSPFSDPRGASFVGAVLRRDEAGMSRPSLSYSEAEVRMRTGVQCRFVPPETSLWCSALYRSAPHASPHGSAAHFLGTSMPTTAALRVSCGLRLPLVLPLDPTSCWTHVSALFLVFLQRGSTLRARSGSPVRRGAGGLLRRHVVVTLSEEEAHRRVLSALVLSMHPPFDRPHHSDHSCRSSPWLRGERYTHVLGAGGI